MGAVEDEQAGRERGADQLAAALRRINDRASLSRTPGLQLPIFDDNPPADDPTTLWGTDDGRLKFRGTDGTVHELGGQADTGPSTEPREVESKKQTKKFVKTYSTNWARTLCPNHGVETGGDLYYGRYSGTHNERRIMLGFNDQAISSDLSGATIREVWIRMRNAHSYYNGGVRVHFGTHNHDTPPGGYSSNRERVFDAHWPKSGFGKDWRRAPNWIGDRFRTGGVKGLTINQPSGAIQFYGAMDPGSFRLRIIYTKQV